MVSEMTFLLLRVFDGSATSGDYAMLSCQLLILAGTTLDL